MDLDPALAPPLLEVEEVRPRAPMIEMSDITSCSRIESMAGFVTWAKFCRK